MDKVMAILKSLLPILEPMGEQGVNVLFSDVIDPMIDALSDSNDLKRAAKIFSPALKQFLISELAQLK